MIGAARRSVIGLPAGFSTGGAPDFVLSDPATSVGVFSTTKYLDYTGASGPNLGNGTTLVVGIDYLANASDQTFVGYCSTNKGWFIDANSTGRVDLFLRAGSNTNFQIQSAISGHQNIGVTRLASGGSIRYSINGKATAQLVASPTYADCDAGSIFTVGRCNNAVGTFACTQSNVLWFAYILEETSDANLAIYCSSVNQINRYRPLQAIRDRINAVGGFLYVFGDNWDGSASTIAPILGTGPTLNVNGTPKPTRNVIGAERVYTVQQQHLWGNTVRWQSATDGNGQPYRKHAEFSFLRFASNTDRYIVDAVQSLTGYPNMNSTATLLNGSSAGLSPTFYNEFAIIRAQDVRGLPSVEKEIDVISGMQGCCRA